jgi:molybdopterin-containing oxidoreductase family iron-sulfur binding subunit
MRAHYAFDKARVVVALDSNFLVGDATSIKHAREFAQSRKAADRKSISRMYSFEAGVSLTGANADHRVSMRSADVAIIAARIAAGVSAGAVQAVAGIAAAAIQSTTDSHAVDQTVTHAIEDLLAHKGVGIVIAGERQSEVHYPSTSSTRAGQSRFDHHVYTRRKWNRTPN